MNVIFNMANTSFSLCHSSRRALNKISMEDNCEERPFKIIA
jgi:hypothetical protein